MNKKQITPLGMWAKYRALFDLYCCHTNEYTEIAIYLKHLIQGYNLRKNHFLDIGAGNGILTFLIGRYFSHTVAVEPNPLFCKDLETKALSHGMQIRVISGFWPSLDIGEECYDLILCTHVLYYIDINMWNEAIRLMLSYLNPGGLLVVILASCRSELPSVLNDVKNTISADIGKEAIWAEDLEKILINQTFIFVANELTANMSTKSYKVAKQILGFLASRGDDVTLNTKEGSIPLYPPKQGAVYKLRIIDKVFILPECHSYSGP